MNNDIYYKFKTPEIAKEIAAESEYPIITHKHWVFKNPNQRFYFGKKGFVDSTMLEPVDISTYPKFFIVQDNEGNFINFPTATDNTEYYVAYNTNSYIRNYTDNSTVRLHDLKLYNFGDDSEWSSPQYKYINHTNDYLKEQIRVRYGFFDRPTNGLSNVVIDSFFPRLLYVNNMNILRLQDTNLPATAVAISPLVANLLNVKQIPTEQLCRVLGYNIKDIKALLTKVKRKQMTFVFAGAGGTGMNTAYWLTEMCKMTNTVNLFRKVWAFDADTAELSNLLRFPIDIRSLNVSSISKVDLILPFISRLSTNKPEISRYFIGKGYYPHEIYMSERIRPNTIVYGAPSVESRDNLSVKGGFICATHAATSASIWLNPKQDQDIQVESYGLIQLGGFFMNQLKMAITLLEILGDDNFDPTEQDKSLLEFEFDGTRQMSTDRTYQWQIDQDMLMMTAEQAQNL